MARAALSGYLTGRSEGSRPGSRETRTQGPDAPPVGAVASALASVPVDVPAGTPASATVAAELFCPRTSVRFSRSIDHADISVAGRLRGRGRQRLAADRGRGTSVAAFVGLAPRGALNAPTLVTNWSQYVAESASSPRATTSRTRCTGLQQRRDRRYVVRVGGTEGGLAGPGTSDGRTAGAVSAGHRGVVTGSERQALTAGEPVDARRVQGQHAVRRRRGPCLGRGHRRPGWRGRQGRRRRRPLPARGEGRRQGRRDLRRLGQQEGRALRRHHAGEGALEGRSSWRRRLGALARPENQTVQVPASAPGAAAPAALRTCRPRSRGRCRRARTSATPPTAPVSAAWRPSTTSPCSCVPDLMAAYQHGMHRRWRT